MTNRDMLRIAMEQSAEDMGCGATDFLSDRNMVVPFRLGAKAKKYYRLPIGGNFVSYGSNVVAAESGVLQAACHVHGVGVIDLLRGIVAACEAHALSVDDVDGGD